VAHAVERTALEEFKGGISKDFFRQLHVLGRARQKVAELQTHERRVDAFWKAACGLMERGVVHEPCQENKDHALTEWTIPTLATKCPTCFGESGMSVATLRPAYRFDVTLAPPDRLAAITYSVAGIQAWQICAACCKRIEAMVPQPFPIYQEILTVLQVTPLSLLVLLYLFSHTRVCYSCTYNY
jgi:hypothetical protein